MRFDPTAWISSLIALAIVFVIVTSCLELVHKAGFSRWYGLLILLTCFLGLTVLAWAQWPIHRELAWLRMKGSDAGVSDSQRELVEAYAVQLEKRGDWKQAIEVYEGLVANATTDEGEDYYRTCARKLIDRLAETGKA